MSNELSDDEVYASLEYQQYLLILDEYSAFSYARDEIIATRERESLSGAVEPPPFRKSYQDYLQTPEWRERAEATKARFGGRCALCDADESLEAHHRTYDRVGHELPEDLTALCSDCHRGYHQWRKGFLRP
ncbi:MAG: hypothetical protein ABI948_06035 [Thermoleophilia bacterium]